MAHIGIGSNKKPKILIVCTDLSGSGGIASVFRVYLDAFNNGEYDFDLIPIKSASGKQDSVVKKIYVFVKAFFLVLHYFTFSNVEIVHLHTSEGASFIRKSILLFLSKVFGKKVILHLHASRFYEYFIVKNKIKYTCINTVLRLSDIVVCLCENWEEKLKDNYPNANIISLPNPIKMPSSLNREASVGFASSNKFNVLFLGFLKESKGIRDLLYVVNKISQNGRSDIVFTVAGKGEMDKEVFEYINKNKLSKLIDFVGWVEGDAKVGLLKSADVFFLPSYNEGMPMAILEAMSFSLPIISTRISGIPELVVDGENGFLLCPGDVAGFYRQILFLAENRNVNISFRLDSFRKVQKFEASKVFRDVVDMYRNLLPEANR